MQEEKRTPESTDVAENPDTAVPAVQLKYATLINYGANFGILFLTVSFFLYMSGIMPSYVSGPDMPQYWTMSAAEYVHALDIPTGWGWFTMIGNADFLGLAGIAFLAGLTIIGYLFLLLPSYLSQKDIPYAGIVLAEVALLVLAASGILAVGAH